MTRAELIEQLRRDIENMGSVDHERASSVVDSKPVQQSGLFVPDDNEADNGSDRAFKKIIALVNVRDRSERGLRERLARCDFEETEIDIAIEKAKSYGFVDDVRFAEVLIRSRVAQGRGSVGIVRELAQNGINAVDVPGWPFEFQIDEGVELDRAIELLERKPPRSRNLREGAFRKLVQKGFPVSIASSAAREWCERNRALDG